MQENEYTSLKQMLGNMSLAKCPDPSAFSRANYMRILQSWRAARAPARARRVHLLLAGRGPRGVPRVALTVAAAGYALALAARSS
jgi:hypothetical protein